MGDINKSPLIEWLLAINELVKVKGWEDLLALRTGLMEKTLLTSKAMNKVVYWRILWLPSLVEILWLAESTSFRWLYLFSDKHTARKIDFKFLFKQWKEKQIHRILVRKKIDWAYMKSTERTNLYNFFFLKSQRLFSLWIVFHSQDKCYG